MNKIILGCKKRISCLSLALIFCAGVGCTESKGERIGGIYDLKRDPTAENIAALRSLLDDRDRDIRATALSAIVTLEVEDAGELAVAALDDEDSFVRSTAAKLVGDQDDPALSGFLLERIRSDSSPLVRRQAVRALTLISGPGAGPAMLGALRDPDQRVRLAAIRGARLLAPGEGAEPLASLLSNDPMWEIRVHAATALGLCGDLRAGDALRAALTDPFEFVRAAATKALEDYQPDPVSSEQLH